MALAHITEEEASFLAEYDPRRFPPVAVTVDVAAFTIRDGDLCILAVERAEPPFKGYWGLPGAFVKPDQSLKEAALAGLNAKANTLVSHIEQLGSYGEPERDPRMRVVSVAYLAFEPMASDPAAGYHTTDAEWVPILKRPVQWAFDHGQIANDAFARAQSKLEYTSLATSFLPEVFTITDLRSVYETFWDRPLTPSNFHRKVKSAKGFIESAGEKRGSAQLFRAGPAKMLYPPIRREGWK